MWVERFACADCCVTPVLGAHEALFGRAPVTLPEAKKGFVLLPRRWVVERSFGWMARFRRLSRDFERLPQVLAGLHFVAFAMLMAPKVAAFLASVSLGISQ